MHQSSPHSYGMNRRDFLKNLGLTAMATGAGLAALRGTGFAADIDDVPLGKMSMRKNLKGEDVSLLGYGCMRWPMKDGKIDQEKVNELVDYAIAHGVTYFDTAPFYIGGASEEATGIALARHPREKWTIATKLSNHGKDEKWRTFEGAKSMYEQSKKRLKVDYIDYYLFHCVGLEPDGIDGLLARTRGNGWVDFLKKEKEAGRIRNLGFSYHGDIKHFDHMLAQEDIKWDFVQIQMNYIDWKNASGMNFNAEYLYNELAKRNIPVVIMEPLRGSGLAKIADSYESELKAREPQQSVASWAFRYAGSFPKVLTVLSGMTYMDHLKDNIRTYSPLKPINEEERTMLEGIGHGIANSLIIPCTACKYCMPCPHDVDIPATFTAFNKCVTSGLVAKAMDPATYKEARKEFLMGDNPAAGPLRQAEMCVGCDECVSHCPQSIEIPKLMTRMTRFLESLKGDGPATLG